MYLLKLLKDIFISEHVKIALDMIENHWPEMIHSKGIDYACHQFCGIEINMFFSILDKKYFYIEIQSYYFTHNCNLWERKRILRKIKEREASLVSYNYNEVRYNRARRIVEEYEKDKL